MARASRLPLALFFFVLLHFTLPEDLRAQDDHVKKLTGLNPAMETGYRNQKFQYTSPLNPVRPRENNNARMEPIWSPACWDHMFTGLVAATSVALRLVSGVKLA
ncbi:hypothetical protein Baya_10194 [Bagarius yarrelli]|uniref:Uncharacterized protein n=1 Tax=Bagarius yarrelli TaxID=175774 RepID=A0A556UFB9_BAGYA|nr:hypothetical protein Baya_10194 [Bagarius yarrelli]